MKKITLTLVITFLSIAFYSCQKSDIELTETPTAQDSENQIVRKSSTTIATLNSFAQGHNDCMDHIATQSGFPNLSCSQTSTIVDNYFGGTSHMTHLNNYCQRGALSDYKQNAINRYNQQLISLEYKDRLLDLIDYFDNYSSLTAFENSVSTYQTTIDQNNILTTAEKESLIFTAAVAIKSINYWTDAAADQLHSWYDVINPDHLPASAINADIYALIDALETESFTDLTGEVGIGRKVGAAASAQYLFDFNVSLN